MNIYNRYKCLIKKNEKFCNLKPNLNTYDIPVNYAKYINVNISYGKYLSYSRNIKLTKFVFPKKIEYLSVPLINKEHHVIQNIIIHNLQLILFSNSLLSNGSFTLPKVLPEYIKKLFIHSFYINRSNPVECINKRLDKNVKDLFSYINNMINLESLYIYHVYDKNNRNLDFINFIKLKNLTLTLPLIYTYTSITLPNNLEYLYLDNFLTKKSIDIQLPPSLIFFHYKGSYNNIIISDTNNLKYISLLNIISISLGVGENLSLELLETIYDNYYILIGSIKSLNGLILTGNITENDVNDVLKHLPDGGGLKYLRLPYYISKKSLKSNYVSENPNYVSRYLKSCIIDIPKYPLLTKYPKLKKQFMFLSNNINIIFNKMYKSDFCPDLLYGYGRVMMKEVVEYVFKTIPPLDSDLILYRGIITEYKGRAALDTESKYIHVSTTLDKYIALAWIHCKLYGCDYDEIDVLADEIRSNKVSKVPLMKYLYRIVVSKGSKVFPLIQYESFKLKEVIIPSIIYNKCKQNSTKSFTCTY